MSIVDKQGKWWQAKKTDGTIGSAYSLPYSLVVRLLSLVSVAQIELLSKLFDKHPNARKCYPSLPVFFLDPYVMNCYCINAIPSQIYVYIIFDTSVGAIYSKNKAASIRALKLRGWQQKEANGKSFYLNKLDYSRSSQ